MNDLVSIVMPAYNASKTIVESIESVISQDYKNWELLVVDDCSSDNTAEIILSYSKQDQRIKYFKTPVNSRVAGARNLALDNVQGNYVAFLDSDDVWTRKKLSIQISEMKKRNSHMSCTSYEVIDIDSNRLGKLMVPPKNLSFKELLKGSKIGCLTVLVDVEKVDIKDLYMRNIGHEDYVTWLNIAKKYGPIHGVTDNLAKYRVFEGSLSGNKKRAIAWQFNIYREEFNLGVLQSLYYLGHYGINSFTKYTKINVVEEV